MRLSLHASPALHASPINTIPFEKDALQCVSTSVFHNQEANKFGPQIKNLASIIRGFKGAVKRYANMNNITFEWQPRYYDHIIRDESEYNRIKIYIAENPNNWKKDEYR